jgi:hypothetical protein
MFYFFFCLVNMIIDGVNEPRMQYLNIQKESLPMLFVWLASRQYTQFSQVVDAMDAWKKFSDQESVNKYIQDIVEDPYKSAQARALEFTGSDYAVIAALASAASEITDIGSIVTLPYKRPDGLYKLAQARQAYEKAQRNALGPSAPDRQALQRLSQVHRHMAAYRLEWGDRAGAKQALQAALDAAQRASDDAQSQALQQTLAELDEPAGPGQAGR